MKKENFVSLIIGTVGLVLFALRMCMAMITEWNTFNQDIVVGTIGIIILIIMLIVRRKMEGKPAIELNKKAIGIVLLGIVGALLLGVGMCMTMVWQGLMVQGIIVGLIGIIILLSLIPIFKGIK